MDKAWIISAIVSIFGILALVGIFHLILIFLNLIF